MGLLLHFAWLVAVFAPDPAQSYLLRVDRTLELCRGDLPAMETLANQAARRLADGGRLFAAGQASVVNEITARAGGIMMIRPLRDELLGANDVVLYALVPCEPVLPRLEKTEAFVVGFASKNVGKLFSVLPNHADAHAISPTLANALPAWIFTGELVAALTRLGKMPVMYETIGGYGGVQRIEKYKSGQIAFHEDMHVPPISPGVLGGEFISRVQAMLRRIEREEREKLVRAGTWARDAKANGKQLFMYSMGHLFPDEIGKTDIGKMFKSAAWNAGFHVPAPEDAFHAGDVSMLIGYQHPATAMIERAKKAGARAVYVSVLSDRDYAHDPDVIWLDPMWNWADACVAVEGYDIPVLPASGIVNGAIAWEIYRTATE